MFWPETNIVVSYKSVLNLNVTFQHDEKSYYYDEITNIARVKASVKQLKKEEGNENMQSKKDNIKQLTWCNVIDFEEASSS